MDFHLPYQAYLEKYHVKYLALYHALRNTIMSGSIPIGTKLPSSRELSVSYAISRGVVNQVYEMLIAEGYLSAKEGSGTFVTFNHQGMEVLREQPAQIHLSRWAGRVETFSSRQPEAPRLESEGIHFQVGRPDQNIFPIEEWNRLMYKSVREMTANLGTESFMIQGHLSLRQAISRYLGRARGIIADPEDIVIVNGSMQAIALLVHLLVDPGDLVVVENPCYSGFQTVIRGVGGNLLPGKLDDEGLVVENWSSRLVMVTPSRQYPSGVVLSLDRRQELLRWAVDRQAMIIEDDFDSEFRFRGRPIEPLKALDETGRVIYVGTFSRTLWEDLRVGYVVLPSGLRHHFVKARQLFEPHPTSLIEQRAIAQFMNSGQFERHLRRVRRVYGRKYDFLAGQLEERLGDLFEFVVTDAGLHIFGWWRRSNEEWVNFTSACRAAGVTWTETHSHFVKEYIPSACFGYTHLDEQDMIRGVEIMASEWQKWLCRNGLN